MADGGSTDGSADIIAANSDHIAWWISRNDRSVADAWNRALPHARGRWVIFLGADDQLAGPSVIASAIPELEQAEDNSVAYGQVQVVGGSGEVLAVTGWPWEGVREAFLTDMFIPHQAVFHRTELFGRVGLFDADLMIRADYELLLRELPDSAPLFLPGLIVTRMRTGGISSQSRHVPRSALELHRIHRRYGLTPYPPRSFAGLLRLYLRFALVEMLGPSVAAWVESLYRRTSPRHAGSATRTVEEEVELRRTWVLSHEVSGALEGPEARMKGRRR